MIFWWLFMCPTLHIVAQSLHPNNTEIGVRIFGTVDLNCTLASSSDLRSYRWRRNDSFNIAKNCELTPTLEKSKYQIEVDNDKRFYILKILNITKEDLGQYICDIQVISKTTTSYYTLKLIECARGRFGQSCEIHCNCLNGTDCNDVDGSCPHGYCAAGWRLNNCSKECVHGSFGQNCQYKCNCLNEADCDHVHGSCPNEHCTVGWQFNNCSVECSHGRFGENCQFKCNCLNGAGCNNVNGSCPNGQCDAGWELNNCSKVSQQECLTGVSFEIFGICISAVIILAVLTVMTVCCYFRRKINQSSRLYEDIRFNADQRTKEDPIYSELGQASC